MTVEWAHAWPALLAAFLASLVEAAYLPANIDWSSGVLFAGLVLIPVESAVRRARQ